MDTVSSRVTVSVSVYIRLQTIFFCQFIFHNRYWHEANKAFSKLILKYNLLKIKIKPL